ncbi:MAG: PTS system mannose/fructose/sorbose family transporter subunit IID [Enterocloster sp.]
MVRAWAYAMMPALRKLYKGKDEELKEAIDRHLLPYISEMSLGNCIMGAALAMEEEIAAGSEGIDGDDVITLKSSLMGPFAGFGDSLLWSTYAPVVRLYLSHLR